MDQDTVVRVISAHCKEDDCWRDIKSVLTGRYFSTVPVVRMALKKNLNFTLIYCAMITVFVFPLCFQWEYCKLFSFRLFQKNKFNQPDLYGFN